MAYGDFKDLAKRTPIVKFQEIKHLILLKIQNMVDVLVDIYGGGLVSMAYKFFDEKPY